MRHHTGTDLANTLPPQPRTAPRLERAAPGAAGRGWRWRQGDAARDDETENDGNGPLRLTAWATLLALLTALAAGGAKAQSVAMRGPDLVEAPGAFTSACARISWLCASRPAPAGAPQGIEMLKLIHEINARVNRSISPLSDPENYGAPEYWTLPANGRGDCEDYALQKYRELLDAGADSRDLSLAVVLDQRRNNHVVLIVRYAGADLVLDSLESRIVPWNMTDYTYLAMQSPDDSEHWQVVADRPRNSEMLALR